MGTHPIFESDFDCLTEIDSYSFSEQNTCCQAPKMELDPLSLILLAILVLLLAGLAVRSLRTPLGDVIAFVGLSESGKTYMVSKLATNDTADPDTQLSIVANQIEYEVENKKLQLVDIPGNEKLRLNELEKYKGNLRGIVFVINSKSIGNQVRDLAELMYSILTDGTIHSKKPKILLAASHQDAKLAKSGTAVQKLLESELHLLRRTQAAALKDTDENAKSEVYLGERNTSTFTFKQLHGQSIEVHECSAKEANLDAVHSWLYSCL